MNIVFELPKLYSRASNGKIKEWKGQVEIIDDTPHIVKIHGYSDGKKQISKKAIKTGKNLGKKNETTPLKQAIMDITSRWNLKKDETYVEDINKIDDIQEIILPMLAMRFKDRKHNIKYSCFVQPKLNGIKCLYQNNKFISRKGKEFVTLDFLRSDLNKITDTINIPDGEIFSRDMSLQRISAAVKKENDDTKKLEYWIYDHISKDGFNDRNSALLAEFLSHGIVDNEGFKRIGQLVYVPTMLVCNEEEIMEKHKLFTSQGYEGTIIRNMEGAYKTGLKRSSDLQKLKDFIDSEFKIIGGKPATGNEDGCVVFKCITEEGKEFDVRPKGSRMLRRQWMKDINKIIGKNLTVRYQNLSDEGVPVIVVGVIIRDYE